MYRDWWHASGENAPDTDTECGGTEAGAGGGGSLDGGAGGGRGDGRAGLRALGGASSESIE